MQCWLRSFAALSHSVTQDTDILFSGFCGSFATSQQWEREGLGVEIGYRFFRFLSLGNETLFFPSFHWKQLINMASRVRHFIYWCQLQQDASSVVFYQSLLHIYFWNHFNISILFYKNIGTLLHWSFRSVP